METLREIYNRYSGTPESGGDKGTEHSYIDLYYEEAFSSYRKESITILEIGIRRGHSLHMWNEYFDNAKIIGVDIVDFKIENRGYTLIYGDATKEETFSSIHNLDIIIDDGSHKFKDQMKTFSILWPKLNTNGLYIIEDFNKLDDRKDKLMRKLPNPKIFDFRKNKNRYDDVLIEIKKTL